MLCSFSRIITLGSPWDLWATQPQILGTDNRARYGFHLMVWALNAIRESSSTPRIFMPLLHQRAGLVRTVTVAYNVCRWVRLWLFFSPVVFIAHSSTVKACQEGWSCQVRTHLFLHDVSQVCGILGGSYLQVLGSNQKHWQSLVMFVCLGTLQINNPKRDNPFLALEFLFPGYWESSSRDEQIALYRVQRPRMVPLNLVADLFGVLCRSSTPIVIATAPVCTPASNE